MGYADSRQVTNRGPAIIAVAAIHAALGFAIVTGLAGGVVELAKDNDIAAVFQIKDLPPPPPPEPRATEAPRSAQQREVFIPPTRTNVKTNPPMIESAPTASSFVSELTEPVAGPIAGPIAGPTLGGGLGAALLEIPTTVDPVAPRPRNGEWVTDNDYRTSWINRGWEGVAAFRLSIGTDGRATNCTITKSSGHDALDQATCRHVTRRARFNPATDKQGKVVPGTFTSAVRWHIPD
ncbi:MAG: TonB family protein [Erythrobacter sp.]|nr:TonB family protein [Erythrobacter sp.]